MRIPLIVATLFISLALGGCPGKQEPATEPVAKTTPAERPQAEPAPVTTPETSPVAENPDSPDIKIPQSANLRPPTSAPAPATTKPQQQPPTATTTGPVVARILGTPIHAGQIDINPATMKQLMEAPEPARSEAQKRVRMLRLMRLNSRVLRPLMDLDVRRRNLSPSDPEIDAVLRWGLLNLEKRLAEDRAEFENPDVTPERKAVLVRRIEYNERELRNSRVVPVAEMSEQQKARRGFAIEVARASIERWRFQKIIHAEHGGVVFQMRAGPPHPYCPEAMKGWFETCIERGDLVFEDEQLMEDFLGYQLRDDNKLVEAPEDVFDVAWWEKAP